MIKYFFIIAQKKWLFKPLSYDCIFKTTYMYLLIANRFVESILTCVPIRSFLHGLAAKAASPVLLATPAGVISRLCRSMSFASQMFSLYQECFSTSKLAPNPSCSILPLPRLVGQALTRLVTVSSMHYCTSTSALSTSSSSRGFTSFEWDISS